MCELCPVEGGVFKRTENNRWVHLLCALYTPGVAFNDIENLCEVGFSSVLQGDGFLISDHAVGAASEGLVGQGVRSL